MKHKPIMRYRLTDHALGEMARRQISEAQVASVLSAPGQVEDVRQGRVIYQAQIESGAPPKTYLLRVFVDIDHAPPQVVTVYRAGKIEKYWRAK